MRADFQQYYHLNIDRIGADFELGHAIELALQLPLGSRTLSSIDPAYSWTNQEYILADIAWVLRTLGWSLSGGNKSGQSRPERITPKQSEADSKISKKSVMDLETYQIYLNIPRKEVAHGNER